MPEVIKNCKLKLHIDTTTHLIGWIKKIRSDINNFWKSWAMTVSNILINEIQIFSFLFKFFIESRFFFHTIHPKDYIFISIKSYTVRLAWAPHLKLSVLDKALNSFTHEIEMLIVAVNLHTRVNEVTNQNLLSTLKVHISRSALLTYNRKCQTDSLVSKESVSDW